MIKISINNTQIKVIKNITILQACNVLNIEVPRFCFHNKLLIAGNCRICLVEVEKIPKPVAACAIPVTEGINVYTETPLVRKARESTLEFLLLNHPLDCPICDQGGECDLQEQSYAYGTDKTRFFYKNKRSFSDKNWGPFIATVITRCIQCTRCIRFFSETVGYSFLGIINRGIISEIGFFFKKKAKSFFSGNVVDLCPVGAISKKKYK